MIEPIIPTRHDTNLGRFYEDSGLWKPSSTTVLSIISKGLWFEKWLGNSGSYDITQEKSGKAADRGTRTHINCESLTAGLPIDTEGMPDDEAMLVMAYRNWVMEVKPVFIATELTMFHPDYPVAGTADIICRIKGQLFLIDLKTGGHYDTHELQLTSYGRLYEMIYGEKPELTVLRLAVKAKNPFFEPMRYGYNDKAFESAVNLWKWRNPASPRPFIEPKIPKIIQLDKEFINVERSDESTEKTAAIRQD